MEDNKCKICGDVVYFKDFCYEHDKLIKRLKIYDKDFERYLNIDSASEILIPLNTNLSVEISISLKFIIFTPECLVYFTILASI